MSALTIIAKRIEGNGHWYDQVEDIFFSNSPLFVQLNSNIWSGSRRRAFFSFSRYLIPLLVGAAAAVTTAVVDSKKKTEIASIYLRSIHWLPHRRYIFAKRWVHASHRSKALCVCAHLFIFIRLPPLSCRTPFLFVSCVDACVRSLFPQFYYCYYYFPFTWCFLFSWIRQSVPARESKTIYSVSYLSSPTVGQYRSHTQTKTTKLRKDKRK